jgi:fucose permease
MLNLVITAYIADLYPDNRPKYVNLLHTFYGIGSFIGPIFATVMYNIGYKWNTGFVFLGSLYLLIVVSFIIILLFMPSMRAKGERSEEISVADTGYFSMLRDKNMIVICIAAFFYMGHQGSINLWLPTYLTKNGHLSTTFMGVVMTSFWVGMVVGRFGYSVLSSHFNVRKFILVGSLAGTAALLAGVLVNNGVIWIAVMLITGIFTGAMFPLLLVIACSWYPTSTASASSIVCVCSTLGSMLFPWLLGNIAQYFSLGSAIYISIINLFIVFLVVWFWELHVRKRISTGVPVRQN